MKKKLFLFCGLLVAINIVASDFDVILTKSRQRIECYILQETADTIVYMSKDTKDATKHQITKNEVINVYYSDTIIQEDKKPIEKQGLPTETKKEENVTSTNIITAKPRIYRDNKEYLCNDTYISAKEVRNILAENDPIAYTQWNKAKSYETGGWVCVGIGCGCALGGLIAVGSAPVVTIGVCSVGLAACGVGLGLALSSAAKYEKAIDIYNTNAGYSCTFKMQASTNGLGLAIAF